MKKIGLIAGSGSLPVFFAQEARKKGAKIVAFAIKDITDDTLSKFVDKIHWIDPARFKIASFALLLLSERLKKMVMVGKIEKSMLFGKIKNEDITQVISTVKNMTDYSLLDEVTKRLGQLGIEVVDGLEYFKDLLPQKGVLTKRHPTEMEQEDISFGIKMAKEIAGMDIGQTIAVKDKVVVSVEAMEGTDATIRRALKITGGGFSVIKVARPKQDMRWDVPLVGLKTLEVMILCKSRLLAIESSKMYFVNKHKVIKEADLNGVSIVVV